MNIDNESIEKLKQLKKLLDEGIISSEDFEGMKSELLMVQTEETDYRETSKNDKLLEFADTLGNVGEGLGNIGKGVTSVGDSIGSVADIMINFAKAIFFFILVFIILKACMA